MFFSLGHYIEPPYVKKNATPKNQVQTCIYLCRAERWNDQFKIQSSKSNKSKKFASSIGGDDTNTVQIHVPDEEKEKNLIVSKLPTYNDDYYA